jgi:CobQ-like glutamine amidotransferase family enzyme
LADLGVVVLYPELLGTYADRGNALAVRHRARLRGLDAEIVTVHPEDPVPAGADLYLLGGAEDATMVTALDLLRRQPALGRALDAGACALGVCAGFQLLGRVFAAVDGRPVEGLGHLDIRSSRLTGPRAVGEVAVDSPLVGELQGFENHRGDARLGPGTTPLGAVVHGVGNGHDGSEGAVQGNVVGTYLHGPVLVRNPALADLLLSRIVGRPLPPVADELVERLRAERHEDLEHRHPWGRRLPHGFPHRH